MTENNNYNTPPQGTRNWDDEINANFEDLDTDVEIRDVEGNLGEYTPKDGAKFMATDTENVFVGDGSSWNKVQSSGKNPSVDSLDAEELISVADHVVDPSDSDAESVINGLSVGESVAIAGTHSVDNPPLTPPQQVAVVSPAWQAATLEKNGDGDLLEDDSDQLYRNIVFDANKSGGYSGNAVRNAQENVINPTYQNCRLINAAQDNYVSRGTRALRLEGTEMKFADRWGVRFSGNINNDFRSRAIYTGPQTEISQNGQGTDGGGVKWAQPMLDNCWYFHTAQQNGGPAFEVATASTSEVVRSPYCLGRYFNNDGPALLVSSGRLSGGAWGARTSGNNENVSNVGQTLTSPYGQIHQEGGQFLPLNLTGGYWSGSGADGTRSIIHHGGSYSTIYNFGAKNTTGEDVEGPSINFQNFAGDQGWATPRTDTDGATEKHDPFGIGAQHTVDYSTDTTFIRGVLASRPSVSTTNAVYVDDGSGSNAAGLYLTTDGGSNWTAL